MSLRLGLGLEYDNYLPHHVNDFQIAPLIFDDFHNSFYIVNSDSVDPIGLEADITIGVFYLLLMESLKFLLCL